MKPITKTIFWLTIFSIAMGYLETAVVVYLRNIYYPEGFRFPLVPVSGSIAITEFWREVATIIMLIGAGRMAGRNTTERFVFFLYSFAIWDIFYYVFLKVLLDWPASLFTWDILFLVPVPWVGPVIAPCIVSLTMIGFMLMITRFQRRIKNISIRLFEWLALVSGSLVIIISFVWDYVMYLKTHENAGEIWTLSNSQNMFEEIKNYVPFQFNWMLFGVGEWILLLTLFVIYKRIKKTANK